MGSILAQLPAWQFFDPLPILDQSDDSEDDEAGEGGVGDDQETLESIIEQSATFPAVHDPQDIEATIEVQKHEENIRKDSHCRWTDHDSYERPDGRASDGYRSRRNQRRDERASQAL